MTKAERNLNQKERKNVGYGLGRLVKTVTSAFKRVFGESVGALNPHTAVIEIATRVATHDRTGDAAIGATRRPGHRPSWGAWPWSEVTAT